ncbi:hypothetical protein [uncultured Microbacterium sp.]|uniref:hypothetical protein n=1 Tax=uncultured Microbacterium sp. TaxID=191216 RepID=UPI002630F17C|nr:hypothetical protein [uncultured Microbacterium sp.]
MSGETTRAATSTGSITDVSDAASMEARFEHMRWNSAISTLSEDKRRGADLSEMSVVADAIELREKVAAAAVICRDGNPSGGRGSQRLEATR